jgi:hypothetical protein
VEREYQKYLKILRSAATGRRTMPGIAQQNVNGLLIGQNPPRVCKKSASVLPQKSHYFPFSFDFQ